MVPRNSLAAWLPALALVPATAAAHPASELPSVDVGLAGLAVLALLFYAVYVVFSVAVGVVVLGVSEFVLSGSYVRAVENRIRDGPGRAGLLGVGAVVGGFVGFVLLLVVLLVLVEVGFPQPVVLVAVLPLLGGTLFAYVGSTVGTIALGASLLRRFGRDEPNLWLALVVGALVANVPVVNFVLAFVVLFVGVGAMVGQWWGGRGGAPPR
ncbi:hypothetical protein [Halorussus halobius]|uniref:hypothetical protein n=1 Tax=Halorussus halobius TaxID=1710537 RepID=UPI0010922EF9|nr:hypothetical protein [Halorussus halobius]